MMGVEILLLVAVIGWGVWAFGRNQGWAGERRHESGEDVLRRRFANGEIDGEEYERRLSVLRSSRP